MAVDARLIKSIPKKRLHLLSGDSENTPTIGDLGETDQGFTLNGHPAVLVYFVSADGDTEWEAEAYESELEPYEGT